MNHEEFYKSIQNTFDECIELSKLKNSDYSDSETDPFGNFRLCEASKMCPVETGLLVRMSDKLARASVLINKRKRGQDPAVKDESIRDTLKDLANYSAILIAYLESDKINLSDKQIVDSRKPIPTEGYRIGNYREPSSMEKGPD